jgi:hypothetical protein
MSQDLVNLVIGVAGAAMGWMLKVVWDSIRLLQDDMKVLERALHTKYVSKDDYKTVLKAIFERLDRKADK